MWAHGPLMDNPLELRPIGDHDSLPSYGHGTCPAKLIEGRCEALSQAPYHRCQVLMGVAVNDVGPWTGEPEEQAGDSA